jgi:hypothetical protein
LFWHGLDSGGSFCFSIHGYNPLMRNFVESCKKSGHKIHNECKKWQLISKSNQTLVSQMLHDPNLPSLF